MAYQIVNKSLAKFVPRPRWQNEPNLARIFHRRSRPRRVAQGGTGFQPLISGVPPETWRAHPALCGSLIPHSVFRTPHSKSSALKTLRTSRSDQVRHLKSRRTPHFALCTRFTSQSALRTLGTRNGGSLRPGADISPSPVSPRGTGIALSPVLGMAQQPTFAYDHLS